MIPEQIHLTEDEVDDALIGVASAERIAHLRGCPQCSAQFEHMDGTIAIFNQAATAWSEAKSNALSRDLNQHRTPFRISAGAAWACASVMALAVTAVLGVGVHERSLQVAAAPSLKPLTQTESASSQEIASDDAMLRQIDAAINKSEPSPDELYGSGATSSIGSGSSRTQATN